MKNSIDLKRLLKIHYSLNNFHFISFHLMIGIHLVTMNHDMYEKEFDEKSSIKEIKKEICEDILNCSKNQIKLYYKRKLIDDQIILKELNIKKNDIFIIISSSFLKSKDFTNHQFIIPKARPLPLSFKDCDINVNCPTLKTHVEKEFSQEKERELREIEFSLGVYGRNINISREPNDEFTKYLSRMKENRLIHV